MPRAEARQAGKLQGGLCPWPRVSLAWSRITWHPQILDLPDIPAFTSIAAALPCVSKRALCLQTRVFRLSLCRESTFCLRKHIYIALELYFSETFSNIYTSRALTDSAASFTYGAKGWLATDCYFDKNTFCLGTILKFIFQVLFQIHAIKCLYVHLGTRLWYRCKRGGEKKHPTTGVFSHT